jgi:hypothetical protein
MINREMTFKIRHKPHNDLGVLARYHIDTIRRKLASEDHAGITLDCRSAAIAIAFFNEAVLNYVGLRVFKDEWNDRPPFPTKLKKLALRLKIDYDENTEPFFSVETLRKARNDLAHSKPRNFKVAVSSTKELANSMRPSWEIVDDPVLVQAHFEHAMNFKEILFAKAKISEVSALTSAAGGG